MLILEERGVGLELATIAFPSLDGCQGIVYQTPEGLWGFHNLGGSATDAFQERAKAFAAYLKQHFVKATKGTNLYGICFHNKRGYQSDDKMKAWKEEMKAFAKELGYSGTVTGFNLDKGTPWPLKTPGKPDSETDSAYVEVRKAGNACTIHYRPNSEMDDSHKGPLEGSYKANHMTTDGKGGVKPITLKIFTSYPPKAGGTVRNAATNQLDTFKV
jgi:hypothetical protein